MDDGGEGLQVTRNDHGEGTVADGIAVPGQSQRSRVLLTTTALVATVAIAWALVANWRKVSTYDWHLSIPWLVGGIAVVLAAYHVNGHTYAWSVEAVSERRPPRRVALSIWGRSLLARYIPGNVMMLVGRAVMGARWGVAKRTTVAATIYEQLIGLGLGALASVLYVSIYGSPTNRGLLILLAVIPVGVACLHPRVFGPLTAWALRRLGREPLPELYTGRQIARLLSGYGLGAVLISLGVWMLVRAAAGPEIGGPVEVSLAFLLAFAVSTVAFIFPSGLGVRDGILAVLFARNLGGGAAGPGLALAVGLRFALVVIELVYVALVVLAGRRR